jgi:hypothetical protein
MMYVPGGGESASGLSWKKDGCSGVVSVAGAAAGSASAAEKASSDCW